MRRVAVVLLGCASVIGLMFGAGPAQAAAAANPVGASAMHAGIKPLCTTIADTQCGQRVWSDCIYDPSLAASTFIESYKYDILLSCGNSTYGVRHIKAGHGFDQYTEACINITLNHLYYKETSNSNPNNWVYSALWAEEGGGAVLAFQSFVVLSKVSDQIVTAYFNNNTYAPSTWQECSIVKF